MTIRLVALAASVAAIAFGLHGLHETRRCTQAQDAITHALFHPSDAAGRNRLPSTEHRLESSCRDPDPIVKVSTLLTASGRRREALALADRATRRTPRSFGAWVAFAQALERDDPAAARAARQQALKLNPLGPVPRAGGAGRPGREASRP